MKKILSIFLVMCVALMIFGCAQEEVSDQDLDAALDELSEEELDEIIQVTDESDDSALAGQAYSVSPAVATVNNALNKQVNKNKLHVAALKKKIQLLENKVAILAVQQSAVELDPYLKSAIKEELGLSSSQEINSENVMQLERLIVNGQDKPSWQKIKSLSGIEQFSNLKTLQLMHQNISDISPVSSLTQLENLHLEDNHISDLSALSNLTNLTYLNLRTNQVSSIDSLSMLTSLETVFLSNNQITDLVGLRHASNLVSLYLNDNEITNLLVDWNVPRLITLQLRNNHISSIVVMQHWNLGALLNLDLRGNQLNTQSCEMRTQLYNKFSPGAGLPAGFQTNC